MDCNSNSLSLPDGSSPFVSVLFDTREVCVAVSPSLTQRIAPDTLIGSALDTVCNPGVTSRVRALVAQARHSRTPVLSIEIDDYFSASLGAEPFDSLTVVPLQEGSLFVHVLQSLSSMHEAISAPFPRFLRRSPVVNSRSWSVLHED